MTDILLFPGSLSSGGIEKHNYHLIKNLDRNRFTIHLALFEGAENRFGPIPTDIKQLRVSKSYIKASRVLSGYIVANKIKIAYSCSFETSMPLLLAKLKFTRYGLILGRRGFMAYTTKRKVLDALFQLFAKSILCNSYKVKSSLNTLGKVKSKVIYNTLDNSFVTAKSQGEIRQELGILDSDYVIGTVGRLCEDKGQRFLIEAFSNLSDKDQKLRLLLIGDGELRAELEEQVKQKGIVGKVIFAGDKPSGGDYIKAMDLFVLPSLTESMPNALLEAMYLEKLSLSTKVGGVPEIIEDKVNGLLLDKVGNSEEIVEKISLVLKHKVDAVKVARMAKATVLEKFSLETNIAKLENEFAS